MMIGQRTTFLSEEERDLALDHLRAFEEAQGLEGLVPPPKGPTNAPPPPPPEADPGTVAEPVPAEEQDEPPTSPEVAGTAGNVFDDEPGATS